MSNDDFNFGDAGRLHNEVTYNYLDQVSIAMRDWYNRGQRTFRKLYEMSGKAPTLWQFNDLMQDMKDHEREGFCMGWNSDAYAVANDMELSVLGGAHASFTKSEGYE